MRMLINVALHNLSSLILHLAALLNGADIIIDCREICLPHGRSVASSGTSLVGPGFRRCSVMDSLTENGTPSPWAGSSRATRPKARPLWMKKTTVKTYMQRSDGSSLPSEKERVE